jgi:hypothetical protein
MLLAAAVSAGGASWHVDDDNLTGTQNGTTHYPFQDIQPAIQTAGPGDTVKVARGSYAPVATRNRVVVLLGGYAGGTATGYSQGTAGDFTNQNPSSDTSRIQGDSTRAVVLLYGTASSGSVLDGFLITGGRRGIESDPDSTWPHAGGVTISRNTVENNGRAVSSNWDGGGINLMGDGHRITGNTIRNNRAARGGGVASRGDSILITGNAIAGNHGYSDHCAGVFLGGSTDVVGNVIEHNVMLHPGYGWGGGVLAVGTVRFSHNVIRFNSCHSYGAGVFVDEGGEAWFDHDLIYGNSTDKHDKGGAGIAVDDGAPGPSRAHLSLCTIANNTSPGTNGGNGLYLDYNSFAEVKDCIFWGNGDDFFAGAGSNFLSVNYTLSQEAMPGTGNLSLDPLFADTASGNFRLRSQAGRWDDLMTTWVLDDVTSPAIDAGDPASPWSLEPEPNGGRINIGFDGNTESASKSYAAGAGTTFPNSDRSELLFLRAAPNPFVKSTTILFQIAKRADIELTVYNVSGQRVRILADGHRKSGQHAVKWDGMDDLNRTLPSGTYFIILGTGAGRSALRTLKVK